MDVVGMKRKERGGGRRAVTLHPFEKTDPGFEVDVYRLSEADMNRIRDKHQVVLGHRNVTNAAIQRVADDTVLQTIASVRGATFNGVPATLDELGEEDFLYFFQEQEFEDEETGQITTLWNILGRRLTDRIKREVGNSQRVSPGSLGSPSQNENS